MNFPQFSTYNSQERKPNGKALYIVFQIAPLSKNFPIFARKVTSAANFYHYTEYDAHLSQQERWADLRGVGKKGFEMSNSNFVELRKMLVTTGSELCEPLLPRETKGFRDLRTQERIPQHNKYLLNIERTPLYIF